jgi:cytochrome c oxidase subunit 2
MTGKLNKSKFVRWIVATCISLGSFLIVSCTAKISNPVSHTPIPNFLNPASPIVAQQARLYWIVLIPAAVVFVIVEGLLLYNVFHHAKQPEEDELPPQHYRQYVVEGIYTGLPILTVVVLFILMLGTMRATAAPLAQPTDINVHVIGHRWWWEFDYPDLNIKTANELHIPVNATVQIDLDSFDVIHSFYVPQLSSKTDVIPGVTNKMWIRGDKIGQFHGQCSEYCGENHANMRFTVFVDSQADFNAWVANQQKPPADPQNDLQKRGHEIIVNGMCAACHDLGEDGPGNATAPDLTHLMSRQRFAGDVFDLNQDNLHRWLEDTQAMKPGNDMDHKFSEEQINALMAYLLTLK